MVGMAGTIESRDLSVLVKLVNNILNPRASKVLGVRQHAHLMMMFLILLPEIIRSRDLRPLDRTMANKVQKLNYRGRQVRLDLEYCDFHVRDGSFVFGSIREILIRDCYFKYHHPSIFPAAKTVVDIGANRGVFSTIVASVADFVLCVEAQPHFIPVIQHNMKANSFSNYAIECATIGSGGALGGDGSKSLRIRDLFQRYQLRRINFLKMDIEGSEFSLFEEFNWLEIVDSLSMEVHRAYGNPIDVIQKLTLHGFGVVLADKNLRLIHDPQYVDFIFASKPTTMGH